MRIPKNRVAPALLLLLLPLLWSCAKKNPETPVPPAPLGALSYVGSAVCGQCHADVAAETASHGHTHMLTPVTSGQKPADPALSLPGSGITWGDLAYVIGGYGWKANFVKTDGTVLTGAAAQYDLATASLVAYADTVASQPYDCASCHTTGYSATGHQGNLAGISGTWAEAGVRCEACHGPGSWHVKSPFDPANIRSGPDAATCGTCHSRIANRALVSGGFIENYQQVAEIAAGSHGTLSCTSCHDPHMGVHKNPNGGGIAVACATCHPDQAAHVNHAGPKECTACHMPYATKSAVSTSDVVADVRTHIFRIRPTTETKETMFVTDPATGQTYVKPGNGVTLDFVCYQCHYRNDPNFTLDKLAQVALTIHTTSLNLAGGR